MLKSTENAFEMLEDDFKNDIHWEKSRENANISVFKDIAFFRKTGLFGNK